MARKAKATNTESSPIVPVSTNTYNALVVNAYKLPRIETLPFVHTSDNTIQYIVLAGLSGKGMVFVTDENGIGRAMFPDEYRTLRQSGKHVQGYLLRLSLVTESEIQTRPNTILAQKTRVSTNSDYTLELSSKGLRFAYGVPRYSVSRDGKVTDVRIDTFHDTMPEDLQAHMHNVNQLEVNRVTLAIARKIESGKLTNDKIQPKTIGIESALETLVKTLQGELSGKRQFGNNANYPDSFSQVNHTGIKTVYNLDSFMPVVSDLIDSDTWNKASEIVKSSLAK